MTRFSSEAAGGNASAYANHGAAAASPELIQRAAGAPEPPTPPEVPRRLRFHRLQLIGVPLLAVLPVLALVGVFSPRTLEAGGVSGSVGLTVRYPATLRYQMQGRLEIRARNLGDTPAQLAVEVERQYADRFEGLAFTPAVTEATTGSYRVELGTVPAGASRSVSVEIRADDYWRSSGTVTLRSQDAAAKVLVGTWVYP